MELHSRLIHAEPGRRVVRVTARDRDLRLGSALGEGATAEEAEDRALERLQRRLNSSSRSRAGEPPALAPAAIVAPAAPPVPPSAAAPATTPSAAAAPPVSVAEPAATAAPTQDLEPEPDPEDWSGELAALDRELQRLGWGREQEAVYLERAWGHPSRSRITLYADLLAYLRTLEGLPVGAEPAEVPVPLRRRDLLLQSDQLLSQLGWGADQGRTFLEQRLGASSRQQLRDEQLLQFNLLLEEALLGAGG